MMKRIPVIFVSFLLCMTSLWGAPARQIDSTVLRELDSRLEEYFRTLEAESIEVKNKECDFLVSSTSDSLLRQHVALKIYDHFMHSNLMGDEAVAVHMTDAWFAPGKVAMNSELDLMNARIFAEFNRQSLLGCKAPPLTLLSPEGDSVKVGGPAKRLRVLYFHSTDCSNCALQTALLKRIFQEKDYPLDFYAVYTGSDASAWKEWREEKFNLDNEELKVINLWDPEISSDYQMKYGLLQTPGMFLLDLDGTIIGRKLEPLALVKLLDVKMAQLYYDYGGDETSALFDRMFSSYGDTLDASDVLDIADMIHSRTLALGDTLSFKHLEGDLLYYTTTQRAEAYKEGTLLFLDKYILDRPDVWTTEDDSLKVIGLAEVMDDMLSRTPVGSRLPRNIPVRKWKKFLRKGGYLVFHTEGCSVCEEELAAADSLGIDSRRIFEIDVDAFMEQNPETGYVLFDTFDLMSMPYIMKIGRRGVVERRYCSFLDEQGLSL